MSGWIGTDIEYLVQLGLVRGAHVVELGCGTGTFSREMATVVGPTGTVCGLDSTAFSVARARELAVQAGLANTTFEAADLAATGLAADCADLVLARGVLGRVTRPAAVVREMVRLTRPGGVVVLTDQDEGLVIYEPEPPVLTELRAVLAERSRAAGFNPHVGRRLFHHLIEAGLEQVRALPRSWVAHGEPSAPLGGVESWAREPRGRHVAGLAQNLDSLAERGELSREDVRRFRKALEELFSAPSFLIFSSDFVAWGTKPLRCA